MSCAATLSAAKDSTNAAASGASAATSVGVVVSGGSTVAAGVGNGGSGGSGNGTGGVAANSAAAVARRFSMEGVGARVIRGPDWKWNKQVITDKTRQARQQAQKKFTRTRNCSSIVTNLIKQIG